MATFRAMSTDVNVFCPLESQASERRIASQVADLFEAAEARFSRFRTDSELSRLNACDGSFIASSQLTAALTRAATYQRLTAGLFDVRVGGALTRCGYDRSFAPGALDRAEPPREPPGRAIVDLGGMIKGHSVDRARPLLPACAALDAGGDMAVLGAGPDGRGWPVEIEDPTDPGRTLATLRLSDAGVATSAANRRTWTRAGASQHHLIDPRTERPSRSDLLQATVVAESTELAEVLAKAAFIGGSEVAASLMRQCGAAGVFVCQSGDWFSVGDLEVSK
jgi:thiamine biosynthesis lipoprotein